MRLGLAWLWFCFFTPSTQAAGILDFNLLDPTLIQSFIPQNVADESIKLFSAYTAHRPLSGATSIARVNGFDLGVEASLVKLGDGLFQVLEAANLLQSGANRIPAAPFARLHLRKGLSEKVDFALSGLGYKTNLLIGGDLKITLHDSGEGPAVGMRLLYTYARVPIAYIKNISSYGFELVTSRPLSFAEPYIGVGGRISNGTLEVPYNPIPPLSGGTIRVSGKATSFYTFTGVYFRILGAQGLRLGMEGAYEKSGFHTLSTFFGLGF